jgi:FtsH-binding integral membrane protein
MSETERLYKRNAGTADALAFSEGLRSYMLGVYNYMALGIAATALIGLFFVMNPAAIQVFAGPVRFVPFVGILALGWFAPRMIMNGSKATAHGAYWGYVALWGLLIGPVVGIYAGLGLGAEVVKAFFITSSVFAAMSLYGYTTKKDLSGWGKFLFMASVGLLVAIVVNVFIGSTVFSLVTSSLVVLVFSAVTAYETQMIRNLYVEGGGEMNERSSIFGAFALYGSFVTLFIHILNILGIMRE